ncbi:MAG: DNA repair protein RecN [Fibrobacteria bacterium]|nr:DNA repair protein RecN [Fibrobacteria bacterium]
MLSELTIKNLAIIDFLHLEFPEGLTVISGETGAGKSILINALKFVSGDKIKQTQIRKDKGGPSELKIEAIFDTPKPSPAKDILRTLQIDESESELILERQITPGGKNRYRINGHIVPGAKMAELSGFLLDLHGQHQQQSLLKASTHINYIDTFAKNEKKLQQVKNIYVEWRDYLRLLASKEREVHNTKEMFDFYSFQFNELDGAHLEEGEEEHLEEKLKALSGLEKTVESLEVSLGILDNEPNGILRNLTQLKTRLTYLENKISSFVGLSDKISLIQAELKEILHRLGGYETPQALSASEIDGLNARLAQLQRLKAKYKTDIKGLIFLKEERKKALDDLENFSSDYEDLKHKAQDLFHALMKKAEVLSSQRKKAGKKFEQEVQNYLDKIGMTGSRFHCKWESIKADAFDSHSLHQNGIDTLEFLFSANAGEEPAPLGTIASGGESSRVMLAIKAVLAENAVVPFMVFDEIDTGIGGETANYLGELLRQLSQHHQIIVITHLPQIAAFASHQIKVYKEISGGRTVTKVKALSANERIKELARMIGDESSESSLEHAKVLLTQK